jgi:hypothetical protein
MTLKKLFEIFQNKKVKKVYIKHLSPNDNSKNQPYFGGDLAILNLLPTGELTAEQTTSQKPSKTSTKFKAPLNLYWIDETGKSCLAPYTQLIFYPQYPEMRFSGFLRNCPTAPSELMDPYKRGREVDRTLILGTNNDGEIFGYVSDSKSSINKELSEYSTTETDTVLEELEWIQTDKESQIILLQNLKRIHEQGWIHGKRLQSDGTFVKCTANPNCGGYTMEAELGISANGYAEPDFMGWEVKQFGVKNFGKSLSHTITLMTPEPDGGVYTNDGIMNFLMRFGYPDRKGCHDRQNFGGVFKFQKPSELTGIRLELLGYDVHNDKIIDSSGGVALVSKNDEITATWSYSKLIDHWKRKHAKTVYIPSIKTDKPYQYHFGKDVTLCKGTDFMAFLKAMSMGSIYLDPAIKAEKFSSASPVVKKRNQIRISFKNIQDIYHKVETIDCTQ